MRLSLAPPARPPFGLQALTAAPASRPRALRRAGPTLAQDCWHQSMVRQARRLRGETAVTCTALAKSLRVFSELPLGGVYNAHQLGATAHVIVGFYAISTMGDGWQSEDMVTVNAAAALPWAWWASGALAASLAVVLGQLGQQLRQSR